MKKVFVILLAVILSTALIGCSSGPSATPTQAPSAPTTTPADTTGSGETLDPTQTGEVKYPLSDGSISLKWWMPMDPNLNFLSSYNEHIVYQALMEATGVNIEFKHPAIGQVKEEFSLLMASGDLPDIIQTFDTNYSGGIVSGLDDGVIQDLSEYIPEYAPDYYKSITESDNTFRQFSTQDGRVAAFYTFWEDINPPAACITLRNDWLREFGLKAEDMTTFTAVESYFQGILDNYPDVAPLYLNASNPIYYYGFNMIPNWYQVDGKATYFANQDGYRGYLELMNKWYKKGYISKDFASYTPNGARSLFTAGKIGCFQEPIGNVYSDAQSSGLEIAKSPYWRMEEGQEINVYFPSGSERNGGQCTVVTTNCENVKEAVMLLNYSFTDAGRDLTNWGVEGVSYTVQSDGSYKYTDLVVDNKDYGTAVTHQLYRIHWIPNRKLPDTTANPNIIKNEELVAMRMLHTTGDPLLNGKYKMPSAAALTTEENASRSSIMSNVDTYVNEMRLKFITGTVELNDASWQEYLNTLNGMNFEEAVSLTQAALDRYLGK